MESADGGDALAELDVGSSAGHIGRDGNVPAYPPVPSPVLLAGLRDYGSLAGMLLGIEDLLDRPIGTLSGGEQQKVYIARAMARRPDVLFLDEPFSSLDRESRAAVAKAIREYVNERGATALVVSHDVSPVLSLVDTIVRMSGGKIVEVGRRA